MDLLIRMASQSANNGLDLNAAVIALFQVPDSLFKAWEENVPQSAQDTLSKASQASGVPKKYLLCECRASPRIIRWGIKSTDIRSDVCVWFQGSCSRWDSTF